MIFHETTHSSGIPSLHTAILKSCPTFSESTFLSQPLFASSLSVILARPSYFVDGFARLRRNVICVRTLVLGGGAFVRVLAVKSRPTTSTTTLSCSGLVYCFFLREDFLEKVIFFRGVGFKQSELNNWGRSSIGDLPTLGLGSPIGLKRRRPREG